MGDDTAESLILNINILNPGFINDLINYLFVFIILLLPFIYLSLTVSHVAYFFYWFLVVILIYNYFTDKKNYKNIIFILSYFLTLIFFEPDFGSFSRHFSVVVLPILIMYYSKFNITGKSIKDN